MFLQPKITDNQLVNNQATVMQGDTTFTKLIFLIEVIPDFKQPISYIEIKTR